MWFANNNVDQFTIAVWLNRTGPRDGPRNSVLFTGGCTGFGAYGMFASDENIGLFVQTRDAAVGVEGEVNMAHN